MFAVQFINHHRIHCPGCGLDTVELISFFCAQQLVSSFILIMIARAFASHPRALNLHGLMNHRDGDKAYDWKQWIEWSEKKSEQCSLVWPQIAEGALALVSIN